MQKWKGKIDLWGLPQAHNNSFKEKMHLVSWRKTQGQKWLHANKTDPHPAVPVDTASTSRRTPNRYPPVGPQRGVQPTPARKFKGEVFPDINFTVSTTKVARDRGRGNNALWTAAHLGNGKHFSCVSSIKKKSALFPLSVSSKCVYGSKSMCMDQQVQMQVGI